MMIPELQSSLWKALIRQGLPGPEAQEGMAPEFRGDYIWEEDPREAAVMVLLYPQEKRTGLALIKRNAYQGHHSAQVSFPGGMVEEGDISLEATALRETREELGIGGEIEVVGKLTPLHIPVSNFLVSPFLGIMKEEPQFRPDPSEVQYVIETNLDYLLDPDCIGWDYWDHHERPIRAPYYRIGKEKVWGATAMMLCEFLQLAARMRSHHYS
jgi:8-oxo-dGTP pyrophosphatase MutT (NUDIX family)